MSDGPRQRFAENATEIASTLVTGIWLVALITGQEWWLAALLFGYVVVVPVVAMLFGDEEADSWWDEAWNDPNWWNQYGGFGEKTPSDKSPGSDASNNKDALETLRNRYARGELTDEQFERKLERLMETDTIENVEDEFRRGERERLRERE